MGRRGFTCLIAFVFLVIMAAPPAGAARAVRSAAPARDISPQAEQILRGMSDYLAGLDRFSVHANTTLEMITPSEMALDATREADVFVERPNKLRVNSYVPDHDRQIVYDGQNVTIYSPGPGYYTVIPAKPTIEETVALARQHGMELPLGDLLVADPYKAVMGRARHAYYIGEALVDGVKTNHLAFRGANLDWQVWVEDSSTPLPRRFVIIDRLVPGMPRYSATLSRWNTNPAFCPDTFAFAPPAGARKVGFVPGGVAASR